MQFLIDVSDGNLNRIGDGPIASATRWRSTTRMDRSGDFVCTIPAGDPKAALIERKRIVTCYALLNGVRTALGGGIIDSIDTRPGQDGNVLLEIAGADLLRELVYRSVGLLEIANSSGAGLSHAAAVAAVQAFAPAGWTFVPAVNPAHNAIYARFAGESVLAACVRVATASGCHFYLSGERQITFVSTWSASGIRAIAPQTTTELVNPATCYIADLSRKEDSYDLITRIYPFGAGQGRARLTLAATTKTAPSGYTLNKASNYIEHSASTTSFGRIERWVEFKEIAPISNTTADVRAAADALFDASVDYLQRRISPASFYRLRLAQCNQRLYPMQTIRTIYRNVVDGRTILNIDQALIILEATTEISADGLRTTDLTVATTDRWPENDASALVSDVAQGNVFQAHPQLNANSYVTGYTKSLESGQNAFFRFRFGAEVTQLQQVLFEFQVLPLESTVKSVGTATTSTSSGGGATVTSASGGATTQTTTSGGGTTVTSASGGATTQTTTDGGGSTLTSTSAPAVTSTSTAGGAATVTSAAGGNVTVTSVAGGGTTQTTTSGGGSTLTSTSAPASTVTSASAPASTVTSTAGGALTVTSAAGGNVTVTSVAGGGTTQTTTTGGNATVTSVAGGGTTQTTTSGGSATLTSASGGSAVVTSASVPAIATSSGAGGGTTTTSASSPAQFFASFAGGLTTVVSANAPSVTSTSAAGGNFTVTSAGGGGTTVTSDSGSGHNHEINLGNSTSGSPVYYAGIGGTGDLRVGGGGRIYASATGSGHTHQINLPTHTHNVTAPIHAHDVTLPSHSHNVTLPDHTHYIFIDGHNHVISIADHSHTVTVPGHTHDVTLPVHTHDVTIPAHSHAVTLPAHSHDVTLPAHSHAVTLLDHQHNVTLPAHTHGVTIPAHSHDVSLPAHSHTVTVPAHNHDVTILAHSHSVTLLNHSHDVSVPAHTHTVTVPAHSHDVSIPTHNHNVSIPAHSHAVTIPSHSHDVSIPAHSHAVTIPSHSHDVSIPNHSHTFTPVINTVYGIFRNDAAGTFGLNELQYRVNSGSWNSLNSAINIGSGWYRLDVTALLQDTTTLRPLQENNLIEIQGTTAKSATIDALLSVRNIIQAIAYL